MADSSFDFDEIELDQPCSDIMKELQLSFCSISTPIEAVNDIEIESILKDLHTVDEEKAISSPKFVAVNF